MLKIFIQRPVLSLVISLFFVLLGLLSLGFLPVTQYPVIEPPAVTVTTKYIGANAETCAKAVVTPLERAINGVPGMTYMLSTSGNDGVSVIQTYFKIGTDPDLAAVNVQNRVSTVLDELPEEVIRAGVEIEKEVNSVLMYLNITTDNPDEDELFLYNFADINILRELKRIDGVGLAFILGSREYAIRIWLKPDRMSIYEVSAEEVIAALQSANLEAAPGKIGQSSGKNPQSFQYVLKYSGKFNQIEEYADIPIKAFSDGTILRVKDIAEVELGSEDYNILSKENGYPSAAIMIKQRPGSNASQIITDIKNRMEELKETSFPPGIDYTISYDVSRFLDASIKEVIKTLIEAFILVAFVVFIFLQDVRSTIIPLLAVPVALIGTFLFMLLFGFSINLLTLFAMVLAIGIVVDNAIVVVEAVHAKMEHDDVDARTATLSSMKEISGAVIGITLVMSSVFIPVAFMPGPAGVFYKQFSITLAIAIIISGINALTLTPALCALLLKNSHNVPIKVNLSTRFFRGFNDGYANLARKYELALGKVLSRRVFTFMILAGFSLATWGTSLIVPVGFIPNEDQGTIYANITTPPGATLERTDKVISSIYENAKNFEEVEAISTLSGYSLMTDGAGSSYGMVMINLKPWGDRDKDVNEIIPELEKLTVDINDADIQFFKPPAVPGYGSSSGFELRLLDKTGKNDLLDLDETAKYFVDKLNERPEIEGSFTSFDATFPQYLLRIDKNKAAQKGITAEVALTNLQTLIGSTYATNFIRFGMMYKVMVQASPEYRDLPEDLDKLFVKNSLGEMVPYSAFLSVERVYGPEQLTRFNMFNSAMINGMPAEGYSSGDAIKTVQEVAAEVLPRGYTFEWSGITRDEIASGSQAIYIFIICLIFVYLLLSAQYESFLLPLPVILSLPVGIFGAYFMLMLLGLELNIYAQIAIVMLIGLLGKNAILIIEFAVLRQKQGYTPKEAVIQAATARLRPILMTSFAIIAGLIPLMIASGAGAIGNNTIGAAAVGGMLFGTIFGVLVIPGLYLIVSRNAHKNQEKNESKLVTTA